MADVWRTRWRIVFERDWGGPAVEQQTVDTVAQLADVVRASQTDGRIVRRSHFRVREWVGPEPPHVCKDGIKGWTSVNVRYCSCGTDHRTFKCTRCQIDEEIPEAGPGCGPLPWPSD